MNSSPCLVSYTRLLGTTYSRAEVCQIFSFIHAIKSDPLSIQPNTYSLQHAKNLEGSNGEHLPQLQKGRVWRLTRRYHWEYAGREARGKRAGSCGCSPQRGISRFKPPPWPSPCLNILLCHWLSPHFHTLLCRNRYSSTN